MLLGCDGWLSSGWDIQECFSFPGLTHPRMIFLDMRNVANPKAALNSHPFHFCNMIFLTFS